MAEKRKNERFPFTAEVEVVAADEESFVGEVRNISISGAFVTTDRPLTFNTKVTLKMALPGVPNVCEIPCIVRWVKEEGAGLQFETLRAIEVWALNKLARKALENKTPKDSE